MLKRKNKTYSAEFYSLPSHLTDAVRVCRFLLLVAGCIAVFGVVYALSNDSIETANRFFVDDEGYALMGTRERSIGSNDVERAYVLPSETE